MRTRPWPLILLALFQIFSPVGTVLFNAWALDVRPVYVLGWILQKPFLKMFESLFLMPLAGIAIYQMKTWSYVVFLGAMIWSLTSNLSNWSYATAHYSAGLMILVYAVQFGLTLYFLIPSVRNVYLNPRLRWWEAKRRYLLQVPVALKTGQSGETGSLETARILNLSEGGMLIESAREIGSERVFRMQFQVFSASYEVLGEVVYANPPAADGKCVQGVMFHHTDESRRLFRRLAEGLELIGIADRDQEARRPWYVGIRSWLWALCKTGKGLVPDARVGSRR